MQRMAFLALVLSAFAWTSQVTMVAARLHSTTPFTSNFHQPSPPLVKGAFKAHWNQHKWNADISHIASGYIYCSPSAEKVRVDETYDSALGSSLFDYTNVTSEGVSNTLWLLSPSLTSVPQFYTGYQVPAFPLIPTDLLVNNNAVYAGRTTDQYAGEVTKVLSHTRFFCSRTRA